MEQILNLIFGLIKKTDMKIQQITLLLFILCFSSINSQVILNKEEKELMQKIPQEAIYLHYNSNFLITGERLFYKVYNLNTNTKKLSTLSKVAYVDIINSKKETILQQKIKLKKGIGYGDFFITSSLKTDNYKIIAYTQWMKNKNVFFEEDVFIYNAFTNPPKIITNKEVKEKKLNFKTYSKRKKVTIPVPKEITNSKAQNFSISVKKINPALFSKKLTSKQFLINKNQENLKNVNLNNTFFIPEFRGELLSGVITSKNKSKIENLQVSLSSINKNGNIQITSTNNKGEFHFNLISDLAKEDLNVQLDVDSVSNYKMSLLKKQSLNYNQLQFKGIFTSKEINNIIKNRSIYQQIENAYNSVKADSVITNTVKFKNYQQIPLTFILDDYKRFNTMQETIVEVVKSCWLENKNDAYTFYVRDENLVNNKLFKPLILVDGHIITNHNELANFHPRKIKSIHVFRKKYILNSKQYHGIINVETFNLSFKPDEARLFKLNDLNISKEKTYFKQNYSRDKYKRIPDYRTQLYWNPAIDSKEITFYTSDVTGVFEINIEGFTNDGKSVSIKKLIEVK